MTSICFECRVLACTQASIYTTTEWANQRKSISVFHINLFIGPGSLNRQLVYWVAQGGIVHQEPFDPFPHFSDICEKCSNHLGELPRAPGPRPGKGSYLKFPLTPMGVLAPVSSRTQNSAWPPINNSGNFSPHMSG